MATTIQISADLHKELNNRKLFDKETYEEVIWDAIEDSQDLNEETKRDIADSYAEIKAGKFHTFSEVKKGLGL